MPSDNKLDPRQIKHRSYLRKIANRVNFDANQGNNVDVLLSATNNELTPPFEMFPSNPLDRVLNIGSKSISNPETSVRHDGQYLDKNFATFTSGTVTLPAASGGTIVVSPTISTNPVLTISVSNFIRMLVEIDRLGNLSVKLGVEGVSEAAATVPNPTPQKLQIGLYTIHNTAGVIDNVTGANIVQFAQHQSLPALNEGVTTTATSGGTTTLLTTSTSFQQFTGTLAHSVQLPDATTMTSGMSFYIANRSTLPIVINYDDVSLAKNMAANSQAKFILVDNSTTNGVWDIENSASGALDVADWVKQGFQNFIDVGELTPVNGAPGAGQFRSEVLNRTNIPDFENDLMPRYGVQRIPFKTLALMPNENTQTVGALNVGHEVYSVVEDKFNQVRLVRLWSKGSDTEGVRFDASTDAFIEVVFWGTDLALLGYLDAGPRTIQISVDGAAEASFTGLTGSTVLQGGKYAANQVVNLGLALSEGLHTVRIREDVGGMNISGIDIINNRTTIGMRPGDAYVNGSKVTIASAQSVAYGSGFDNEYGTSGTKGGRIITYVKNNGTVGKDIQWVDVTANYYIDTDHSNEEVSKNIRWDAFGAQRSDDFSTVSTVLSAGPLAYTLDDGVTTLKAVGAGSGFFRGPDGGLVLNQNTDYIELTFVGTGIDFRMRTDGSATRFLQAYVDDQVLNAGSPIAASLNVSEWQFCASGLSYGTHTLTLRNITGGPDYSYQIEEFRIWRPKTPPTPDTAALTGVTNLMADFVSSGVTKAVLVPVMSSGLIFKDAGREMAYYGTGWSRIIDNKGWGLIGSTNGDYIEFWFYGTGFDLYIQTDGGATDAIVAIDGSNYTGAATAIGAGSSWTSGTSIWIFSTSDGAHLYVTGLSDGYHKVRVTKNSGAGSMFAYKFAYMAKLYNETVDINPVQDNFLVGSNSLGDARELQPVKDQEIKPKFRGIARGTVIGPTITSTDHIPVPDLFMNVPSPGAWFKFTSNVLTSIDTIANWEFQYCIDGILIGPPFSPSSLVANSESITSVVDMVYLPKGMHQVALYARVFSGTGRFASNRRRMIVEEL